MKARRHGPVPAICGLLAFCFVLLSENMPRERSVAAFTLDAFGVLNKALKLGGQRSTEMCKLVKKETLVEGKDRGEPVRRFTFQAPVPVNVSTGLRQVMVVLAPAGLRMYSPTSEPRADGTFELVVRVYRKGAVSRWLDSLSLGDPVKMMWPWPCPLPEDRRNPGPRVGLIAFGVGVTELYRTAVQELADPNVEEVTLLYATRTWEEQQVLAPELEELQKREPKRFRLERILSREKRSRLRHGRVDPALLQEVFPWQDFSSEARFVCAGTSQMMDMAYEYLCDLGYEQDGYKLIRDAKLPSGFDLFKKLASLV